MSIWFEFTRPDSGTRGQATIDHIQKLAFAARKEVTRAYDLTDAEDKGSRDSLITVALAYSELAGALEVVRQNKDRILRLLNTAKTEEEDAS